MESDVKGGVKQGRQLLHASSLPFRFQDCSRLTTFHGKDNLASRKIEKYSLGLGHHLAWKEKKNKKQKENKNALGVALILGH